MLVVNSWTRHTARHVVLFGTAVADDVAVLEQHIANAGTVEAQLRLHTERAWRLSPEAVAAVVRAARSWNARGKRFVLVRPCDPALAGPLRDLGLLVVDEPDFADLLMSAAWPLGPTTGEPGFDTVAEGPISDRSSGKPPGQYG